MAELKPCPFCGSEAQVRPPVSFGTDGPYIAGCMSPLCMTDSAKYPTHEKAIEAWNRRTPSRDSEAITALKKIQQEGMEADRQSVDFLQTIINRIVAIASTAILKGAEDGGIKK